MTWQSLSDDYTGRPTWDAVSYEARWHYLTVTERCVRDRRWDGVLPLAAVLRCSDVPDPAACVSELVTAGLLTVTDGCVQVDYIEDHLPPPHQRDDVMLPRKRANQAAYRQRRCDGGTHDRHCPPTCPARARPGGLPGGLPVTPGRDGSGRADVVGSHPDTAENA